MSRAALLSLLLLEGCAYSLGGLHCVREVRLQVLDARPERRTHEFDLTQAIARELVDCGIRVNPPRARHELAGDILDFDLRTHAVDELDVPIIGAVSVRLRIRLVDLGSRSLLFQDERTEEASFSNRRSETLEMARREVFDRLARWVAARLEVDW